MGKKNKVEKQQSAEVNQGNGNKKQEEIEGKFLLGKPKFKKLDNGRYKCVQTGHELHGDARESYAITKHCRLGLIDYSLARNKPPLNMFRQDPLSRSTLICELTGHTVNKTEEHIWKHINGKRFLNMLEKEEAEGKPGKEASDGIMEEEKEEPEKAVKSEHDNGLKKKQKQKQKQKQKNVSKMTSEVKSWDFDNGKDRWVSGSGSGSDPETDDANKADAADKESINDTGEFPNTTKRTSVEIKPSDFSSSKKKKTQST